MALNFFVAKLAWLMCAWALTIGDCAASAALKNVSNATNASISIATTTRPTVVVSTRRLRPQMRRTTTPSLRDLYDDELDAVDQPDFVNPIECRELVVTLGKQNRTHKEVCGAVLATDGCQSGDSYINYVNFLYCSLPGLQWYWMMLGGLLYTVWIAVMFLVVGVVADAFFCSSLEVLSEMLHMSQSIAGVTFLALGTGAPDVFSSIAAVNSAETAQPTLALGSLLGGGLLAITVIAGTLFSCTPFELARRPFMRDMLFYTGTVGGLVAVLWKGSITQLEGIGFLLLYAAYASIVIFGRVIYVKWVHRKKGPDAAAKEEIDHDEERQVVSEILRPPMRLSFCRTDSVRSLRSQTSRMRRASAVSEKSVKRRRDMELLEIPPTAACSAAPCRASLGDVHHQGKDQQSEKGKVGGSRLYVGTLAASRSPSLAYGDLPSWRHRQFRQSKSLVDSIPCNVNDRLPPVLMVNEVVQPVDSAATARSDSRATGAPDDKPSPIPAKKPSFFRRWLRRNRVVVDRPNTSSEVSSIQEREQPKASLELPDIIRSLETRPGSARDRDGASKFDFLDQHSRSSSVQDVADRKTCVVMSSSSNPDINNTNLSANVSNAAGDSCRRRISSSQLRINNNVPAGAIEKVKNEKTERGKNLPSIEITTAPKFDDDDDGHTSNRSVSPEPGVNNKGFIGDEEDIGHKRARVTFAQRKLTAEEMLHYYGDTLSISRNGVDAVNDGENGSNSSTVPAGETAAATDDDDEHHHELLPWYIDVFEHVWPLTLEQWQTTPCILRAFSVLKIPIQVVLFCIIPLVDTNEPSGLRNWCKWLQIWHLAFSPGFCVFLFTSWHDKTFFGIPLYVPVFGLSCAFALIVAILTRRHVAPRGHSLFAVLGFVCAVSVIYKVANEIVGVLTALGVMFRLSPAMLGLTLLAWGNSVPELISSYALARHGFQRVAVSSCYAGPMFAALVGTGLAYTIGAGRMEGKVITFSAGPVSILLGFYVLGVCCLTLVAVPLQRFKPRRRFGFVLLGLYVLFIPIIILAELKVY